MSENNIAVQHASGTINLLLNGVAATAQQVYDAFMAGPVRLSDGGTVYAPIQIAWENSDGTQTNPKAVTYVKIFYIQEVVYDTLQLWSYDVGTKYVSSEK